MQNISDPLRHIESIGLVLSFDEERGLRVVPKEKITSNGRAFITEHKAEIISQLLRRAKLNELPERIDVEGKPSGISRPPANRKSNAKISPVALDWLIEHRQALDKAGWTRAELYRRSRYTYKQGIAWLRLWDEAFSMAYLHEDGTIEFECSIHGRDFFQTARPRAHKPIRKNYEKEMHNMFQV
jgi:hypothetical protein